MKIKHVARSILLIVLVGLFFFSSSVRVYASEGELFIGGFPLGFDLSGEGVLVVGFSEVVCEDGVFVPVKDSGITVGDYILSLNGKAVNKADDVDELLKDYDGHGIIAEILSEGKKQIKNLYPKKDLSGKYKLGVMIRDYLSGLGTVTFVKENGEFCSLGHPITDEEGTLLNISGGLIYGCKITSVEKGVRGQAGELQGLILRNKVLGKASANTAVGLIGKLSDKSAYLGLKRIASGTAKPGSAEIYATIEGETPQKYTISIVKTDENDKRNKNLVIKITDEKLIEQAGGIVRGMSGSPIIQDGRLVGAVTHVFLNDSTRGYGISVAKMLQALA